MEKNKHFSKDKSKNKINDSKTETKDNNNQTKTDAKDTKNQTKIDANKKQKKEAQKKELPLLRNCIKIRIEGYNQNRLISSLLREKISIATIDKKSLKEMDIVINVKNKQKAIALIQKLCYNYSIVEVSGIKPIASTLLARIGLLIGALIFAVVAVLSNSYIWRIDISGNEKIDDLTIVRALQAVDVSVAKSKRFDTFEVASALNSLDGIVECTVNVVGTTVKIKVIEAKDYIPPDGDNSVGDIVSLFDAEITKVTVSGGTGKVRIGDRIPKGSVLISREMLNSNGEPMGEVKARGSVYGKVIFSDTTYISTTVEEALRTGKQSRVTSLGLFGLNIGGKANNTFKEYQSVTTESYAFYNTFLPILVRQTTYYEVEKKLVERPIDELVDEYKRQRLLELIISAGGSEINTTVTKEEISEGLYKVHLYMEAEMQIGTFIAG